jgi:hypothetical protein
MYIASNLTPREAYRLNGQLSHELIESLLDTVETVEGAEGVSCHVQEAIGCFPKEDFLASFIDDLYKLSKRLRGENKAEALHLIEKAEDLQQCVFNEGDYGRSELREANKALEEAGL